MSCCVGHLYNNWCDGETQFHVHGGREYCIFHLPVKGTNGGLFIDEVVKKIHKGSPNENIKCKLDGTVFRDDIVLKNDKIRNFKLKNDISLKYCVFHGRVKLELFSFKNLDLTKAEFKKDVMCKQSSFAELRLESVSFRKKLIVENVCFTNNVSFSEASFEGRVLFEYSRALYKKYKGDVEEHEGNIEDLKRLEKALRDALESLNSGGKVDDIKSLIVVDEFLSNKEASINDEEYLKGVLPEELAEIDEMLQSLKGFEEPNKKKLEHMCREFMFSEGVGFNECVFRDYVIFKDDVLAELVEVKEEEEVWLGNMFTENIIEKNVLFRNVNIRKMAFMGTDMNNVNLIDCVMLKDLRWISRWLRGGENMLYDEQRYIDSIHWQNSDNCPSGEDRNKTLKRVEVLYRQLKEKNINEHNWEYVSFWNFREKSIEMERHKLNGCFVEPVRRESLTRIKKLRHLFKYVGLRIYKFLSGYNESPLQAGMVLLLMFTGLGLVLLKNGESWDNLMDSLEVLPFIKTVKEVDGVSGWVRAGVIFFQTLITIQIALVIMSVRNKLRR